MSSILLTQSSTFIIGPVAKILGILMNGIYNVLNNFGIQNIGLCIIIFTFIMYMLMLPLTIKQQKFSRLSAKMNPELQAIQKKYKGKKDQASMEKLNLETKLVYEKYGTSPTGSCLQMAIQLPVLFSLYQVINNVPAYVESVKGQFSGLATSLSSDKNIDKFVKFYSDNKLKTTKIDTSAASDVLHNSVIDALYKLTNEQWDKLNSVFSSLSTNIESVQHAADKMNSFFTLNIAESPTTTIMNAFTDKNYFLIAVALLIPLLAAATQMLNVKLMPQPSMGDDNSTMAASMKSLNTTMPIISAVFCFSAPVGLGLYWIAGALIRSVQQLIINRHLNNMDIDELIRQNQEKAKHKKKHNESKQTAPSRTISSAAKINTKNISDTKSETENSTNNSDDVKKTDNSNVKLGSMAAKANLVKQFNEKNSK